MLPWPAVSIAADQFGRCDGLGDRHGLVTLVVLLCRRRVRQSGGARSF
jgi:hypothetical protein